MKRKITEEEERRIAGGLSQGQIESLKRRFTVEDCGATLCPLCDMYTCKVCPLGKEGFAQCFKLKFGRYTLIQIVCRLEKLALFPVEVRSEKRIYKRIRDSLSLIEESIDRVERYKSESLKGEKG